MVINAQSTTKLQVIPWQRQTFMPPPLFKRPVNYKIIGHTLAKAKCGCVHTPIHIRLPLPQTHTCARPHPHLQRLVCVLAMPGWTKALRFSCSVRDGMRPTGPSATATDLA